MIKVSLLPHEIRMAVMVGVERCLQATINKAQKYNWVKNPNYQSWDVDIEGAAAEYAAAKGLGMLWDGSVNTWKKADLGDRIQVRSAQEKADPKNPGKMQPISLIVRKDDKEEENYILVIGSIPHFRIVGWCSGVDAMQDKYRRNPHGGVESWFVPQEDLKPIEELLNVEI
jgi:hypothetical protein